MLGCLVLAFSLCNPNTPYGGYAYVQPQPQVQYVQPQQGWNGPPQGVIVQQQQPVVVVQAQPAVIPWVFWPGVGWGWWHGGCWGCGGWHGNGWSGHWHGGRR